MDAQTITDDNGEVLRLIARMATTAHNDDSIKSISTDSTTVEVIVSDGRVVSQGSQWGHVVIVIDGMAYGMSHNGYDKRAGSDYLGANAYRDSIGVILRVSPGEKEKMRNELERRRSIGGAYDVVSNSCSTNVADVLESIGILAHDPRFFFAPSSTAGVAPKELLVFILRSKRVAGKNNYPKK
jgi:hypothetical protein